MKGDGEEGGAPEASGKPGTGLTARAAVATRAGPDGGTRITVLRSDGPLALRATPAGVYLVGAAAGPVGGDDLGLEIDVGPGTTLLLRSAAAALLLPGPRGDASRLRIRARVAVSRICCLVRSACAARADMPLTGVAIDDSSERETRLAVYMLAASESPADRQVTH